MKKESLRIGILAITTLVLFNSCTKDIFSLNHFPDPLESKDQVAEYHVPQFDTFFPEPLHYLFGKKFDHSGRVREIICSFTDDLLPGSVLGFQLDLQVVDKGRIVYLITLDTTGHGVSDTSARIYLNAEGRPDSCIGNYRLAYDAGRNASEKTYYFYKEHRLFAVKNATYFSSAGLPLIETDTVHYDRFGNPLSFGSNSYEYDYTRTAKEQFYCDDYMGGLDEFYLLQYLGYFPEINSPVNIRTRVATVVLRFPITGHQFDAKGRLTGYDFVGHISITWE